MISVKYASIIAVAAFVAGSFFASPELRAYASTIANDVICTGCVGTSDLAGNAVTAAKIKDGEVKAAEIASNAVGSSEIATDAVGGSELQGVTKLLFGQCATNIAEGTASTAAGNGLTVQCTINGVDSDDSAIALHNTGNACFEVRRVGVSTNEVAVLLINECSFTTTFGIGSKISIIVFDK